MKFTHTLRYEASPDRVRAMLVDQGFRERVCQVMKSPEYTVSTGPDDVTVKQQQRVRKVPAIAMKFVGETVEIVQREHWDSPTKASLTWEIPGKPGNIRGTITLSESAGVTTETLSGDITVNIPLVGGKLEGVVDGILQLALKAEQYAAHEWLAS